MNRLLHKLQRRPLWAWAVCAGYAIVVLLYWSHGSAVEGWDDSYFFKRIGLHILEHGSASWNLSDGPVYGNTSQGFQLLVLLPLVLNAAYYVALVKLLLALCCMALFALLFRSAQRQQDKEPLAIGVALLAASAPVLLLLIHSGMETIPAMALLVLNLVYVAQNDHSRRGIAKVVVTTVLLYLFRPDAVLITIAVVALYHIAKERRVPWRLAISCALALACTLLLLYLYFGTAFPLSFYLKSRALTSYTDQFTSLDLIEKRKNIYVVLLMAAPLLYIAGHGRKAKTWRTALVASFMLFISYHYLSTVEIMSYRARFYLPGLIPLAIAAMVSAKDFRERSVLPVTLLFLAAYVWLIYYLYDERMIWTLKAGLIARVPKPLYLSYALGAGVLLVVGKYWAKTASVLLVLLAIATTHRSLSFPDKLLLLPDEALLAKHIVRHTTVRGIDAVRACLPEPLHIYHTEIGIPGVVFADSKVTDMAGLMNKEIGRKGMDFERHCSDDQPDLVFLPHRNYKALRSAIDESECINGYVRVVRDSSSPLYLRKELIADFLPCAAKVGDAWVGR